MTSDDLVAVQAIADRVHVDFPEGAAVFAERLLLYPQGCFVLVGREGATGYVISHPWTLARPPALNTMLGTLPSQPSTFYIHDLALLPAARGSGAAAAVVTRLIAHAVQAGFATMSLVAVNGSAGFWERHGFHELRDAALATKLASYGADARLMVCRCLRRDR